MAYQKGIVKIKGTINDMTFYKSGDGFLVKGKSEVSKERIANDPAFIRTRENNSEFGRAGKGGKVLRNSIRLLLQSASDAKVTSRLTKQMMIVVKADATSERGLRNVIDGEVGFLKDFDFNINAKLGTTLYAPYTFAVDRVTGTLTLDVPPFLAASSIAAPDGATHFKIVSAATEVDFEAEEFVAANYEGDFLPLSGPLTAAINISHAVTPASTHPLFLFLGLQFFQQVNGSYYVLRNGAFNCLSIIEAAGV